MSLTITGNNTPGSPGVAPGFSQALRGSFLCGILRIDPQTQTFVLTEEAARMLGLEHRPQQGYPLAGLPRPVWDFVLEVLGGRGGSERRLEWNPGGSEPQVLQVSVLPAPGTGAGDLLLAIQAPGPGRELEQKLRRLERLADVGTLSAGLAHEIKNALVAVKTFSELLIEKNRDTEMAELVRRELARVETLTNRVLTFSAPPRSTPTVIGLHETLEHTLRLVQPKQESLEITVDRRFEALSDRVRGDGGHLQQAFMNLMLNALESMGPGGVLTVATHTLAERPAAQPDQICLRFADTGHGVTPENLGRLFEPFFTTKPTGTGLGLWTTRQIIQEHQGEISVQSQPGQGTTFTVLLPAAVAAD